MRVDENNSSSAQIVLKPLRHYKVKCAKAHINILSVTHTDTHTTVLYEFQWRYGYNNRDTRFSKCVMSIPDHSPTADQISQAVYEEATSLRKELENGL